MKERGRERRPAPRSAVCVGGRLRRLGARVLLVRDDLVDAAGGEYRHREGLALLEGVEDLLCGFGFGLWRWVS